MLKSDNSLYWSDSPSSGKPFLCQCNGVLHSGRAPGCVWEYNPGARRMLYPSPRHLELEALLGQLPGKAVELPHGNPTGRRTSSPEIQEFPKKPSAWLDDKIEAYMGRKKRGTTEAIEASRHGSPTGYNPQKAPIHAPETSKRILIVCSSFGELMRVQAQCCSSRYEAVTANTALPWHEKFNYIILHVGKLQDNLRDAGLTAERTPSQLVGWPSPLHRVRQQDRCGVSVRKRSGQCTLESKAEVMAALHRITETLRPPRRQLTERQEHLHDLGILVIVSNEKSAEQFQKAFDPDVMMFINPGRHFARRFRAVFVATEAYVSSIRYSTAAIASFQDYLEATRCRLAEGCEENFFVL